tara:strand:- start:1163 stop:1390 length:228 start_codon:yes stop_codon:yes gene_type:complete
MNTEFLLVNNIFFLLIKNTILDMTINNPIFIFAMITVIWFIPGIVVKSYKERKQIKQKEESQAEAIQKLYPKKED